MVVQKQVHGDCLDQDTSIFGCSLGFRHHYMGLYLQIIVLYELITLLFFFLQERQNRNKQ